MGRKWLLALVPAACLVALLLAPGGAPGAPPSVSTFPIPGARVASPQSQIAFRGVPAGQLGSIVVSGSRTGVHSGSVGADSDGHGGSFVPAERFVAGEVVTVSTSLNVVGATDGRFQFTIANQAGGFRPLHWPPARRVRGDVQRFRSRPDLAPAAVRVDKRAARTAPGDIFIGPQFGPVQDGPMILDPRGKLIWFKNLGGDDSASDFRTQTYQGRPVLTWWQGYVVAGVGVGEDVINDTAYRQLAVVHAANGLSADLHDFQLTPQNTALITAYYPVYWDASTAHGPKRQITLDAVVQEIDIPTGLVLFQWDSLDHIPVADTHEKVPKSSRGPFDYFHVNSLDPDRDGNLVISGRNTWAAYKVNKQTGAVIWRLGGRHSSFRLARGVSWAFQHDVRVHANNDRFVTLFDNGAGPPKVQKQSRGIKLMLDLKHMTAKQVAEHVHTPAVSSNFEGDFQQLPNRDDFLGWGQQPYFSEYDPHGRLIFDGRVVGSNASYRAYRFRWSATPAVPPDVAAINRGHTTTVYASWNGATSVASWRVLGGSAPTRLRTVKTAAKRGFETSIAIGAQRYVAVQALDRAGHTLQASKTVPSR
jgi:Arylsulfotransferase (ASST)